jgi:tRNA threonylcarbamoyladenosine biosynthesis protein TsaB
MIVLALDTTTRAGSAAVLRDGTVLAELPGDPSLTHGQRLPGELMRVLDRAGVRIDEVDLFAVAAGPGSFTGLRVGIATVQGLAMARTRRVVPVSTLDALARAGANPHRPVAAWVDAQRGDVAATLYAPDGREVIVGPQSAKPEVVMDRWGEAADLTTALFIGDGAVAYRELVGIRAGDRAIVTPAPPLAGFVGAIAAADPERGVLPHAVAPIYIRVSDAELARARRAT